MRMMWTDQKLTQAADDIVWEGAEDALRRIIEASGLEYAGVDALEAHHRRIAARYKAVARAMQD